jgi:hypothetical protein
MTTPSIKDEPHQPLIDHFRAHLHTVITAEQYGQTARLRALPGAKTEDYCLSLAKLPDNTLAGELAAPVLAIIRQIDEAAMRFHRPLFHKQIKDPARQAEYEEVLEQVDFALALIMRQLPGIARFRAKSTKCSDLLCEVTCGMAGHGPEAVSLIRRYKELFPEQFHGPAEIDPDTDLLGDFAWDTYQRVEALDRLADEFPVNLRAAARSMHGWPMLVHRHTNSRKRFQQLAAQLELGINYPLDASGGAKYRPDTPLVRYLDPLICNLNFIHDVAKNSSYESVEEERKDLLRSWWDGQAERPGDDVVELLRALAKLPPLTKATAAEWSEKAVVPVIMATDARDWKNCGEPALRRITKQSGVKSRATFKSRLLSAVASTLRRLARPG